MMRKQHGPAFKAYAIELTHCQVCKGKTVIPGVFHELACVQCNASGWVTAETGEALPLEVLVTQLSIRLQASDHQIKQLKRPELIKGPAAQYDENNRRGAGGTNYTGD